MKYLLLDTLGPSPVVAYCEIVTDVGVTVPSKLRLATCGSASSEYVTAAAPGAPSSPSAPGLTL